MGWNKSSSSEMYKIGKTLAFIHLYLSTSRKAFPHPPQNLTLTLFFNFYFSCSVRNVMMPHGGLNLHFSTKGDLVNVWDSPSENSDSVTLGLGPKFCIFLPSYVVSGTLLSLCAPPCFSLISGNDTTCLSGLLQEISG